MNLSKFISYFFHPINFSIIGAFIYFLFVPKYIFKPQEYIILVVVFVATYLIPLMLLFSMKRMGMINSYHLTTIEERKFPLLLFISISVFIGYWLLKSTIVDLLSLLYFGYGLSLFIIFSLLFTNRKISLHTAAIGGLIGFLIYFSYFYKINLLGLVSLFFLLAGIVASARLQMKAHSLNEVIVGFLVGLGSQFIVYSYYIYSI